MWLIISQITVYMLGAALIGLILGWVLRGVFGQDQLEISELRAQIRALKKTQREAEKKASGTNKVTMLATKRPEVKKPQAKANVKKKKVVKKKVAKKTQTKKVATKKKVAKKKIRAKAS